MANFQLGDTEKAPYALTALDGDSNPTALMPGQVVSIVSSAPASASVVPDAVAAAGSLASGFIVGGAALAVGVTITASVTLADGVTPGLSVVDMVDVVGGTATSLSLGLGAPVAQ